MSNEKPPRDRAASSAIRWSDKATSSYFTLVKYSLCIAERILVSVSVTKYVLYVVICCVIAPSICRAERRLKNREHTFRVAAEVDNFRVADKPSTIR